jgi:hypothetical protein
MNKIKQLLLLAIISLSAVQMNKAYDVVCKGNSEDAETSFAPDRSFSKRDDRDEAARKTALKYCRNRGFDGVDHLMDGDRRVL